MIYRDASERIPPLVSIIKSTYNYLVSYCFQFYSFSCYIFNIAVPCMSFYFCNYHSFVSIIISVYNWMSHFNIYSEWILLWLKKILNQIPMKCHTFFSHARSYWDEILLYNFRTKGYRSNRIWTNYTLSCVSIVFWTLKIHHRNGFPRLFWLCLELLGWNLVCPSETKGYRSSLNPDQLAYASFHGVIAFWT